MKVIEKFNSLEVNDFVKLPKVFDLGIITYKNSTYNSVTVYTSNRTSEILDIQTIQNLEIIPDFDFESYVNERILKMRSSKEVIQVIIDNLRFESTLEKFNKIHSLEQGWSVFSSRLKQEYSLPYLDKLVYNVKAVNKAFDYTNFELNPQQRSISRDYNFDTLLEFNLDNMDTMFETATQELTTTTILSNKFRNLILKIEGKEEIKTYLLEGNYYLDIQFVDITGDKTISFTPKNKSLVFEDFNISTKNRQEMKPHKFFNKVLKDVPDVTEYDIKCFTDNCLANMDEYEVKYVEGYSIGEYYNEIIMEDWLVDSCMQEQDVDFFDIYADNPFRMGIVYSNGEIVGRFLEVTADGNFVYNDRIYYQDNEVLAWYKSWCDKNDMVRRTVSGFAGLRGFYQKSRGGDFEQAVTLTLKKSITSYEYLPYVDTLRFAGEDLCSLNNYCNEGVSLESTEGEYEGMDYYWDVIDKTFRHMDDMTYIEHGEYEGEMTHYDNCCTNSDDCIVVKEELL